MVSFLERIFFEDSYMPDLSKDFFYSFLESSFNKFEEIYYSLKEEFYYYTGW